MIDYVEDDASIRELVVYTLTRSGFHARGFAEAASFREALAKETPELILLDVMLPGEDGVTLLQSLKASPATSAIPVIMLTAKGAEYDKVASLDMGADDYVVKPFGMMELVSRVRAVLRRSGSVSREDALRVGEIELNPARHSVSSSGEPVQLTFKEFELLRHMMENPGLAFTREQLLDAVWGYDYFGGTRTVDVHIQTLRQKLGAAGGAIQTVRGVGYRMER